MGLPVLFRSSGTGTFSYVASGGITFAGAAAVSRSKDWVASGGLTLAGASVLARAKHFAASGGVLFAGAGAVTRSKDWTASGGWILAGVALTEYTGQGATFVYGASGGIAYTGGAYTGLEPPAPASFVGAGGVPIRRGRDLIKKKPAAVFRTAGGGGFGLGGSADTRFEPVPTQAFEVIARAAAPRIGGGAKLIHVDLARARAADELDLLTEL